MATYDPIQTLELNLPDGQKRAFQAPQSMLDDVRQILSQGSYNVPIAPGWKAETVVDIGANCGAFSMFAHLAFAGARILAFEPGIANFGLLARNTEGLPKVEAYHCGLYDRTERRTLYYGAQNPGQSSILPRANQRAEGEEIELRQASTTLAELGVERISVLKIDTEGCEVPILQDLGDLVSRCDYILLEYHLEDDRRAIDQLLADDFYLIGAKVHVPHCGELKFVHREVLRRHPDYALYCQRQEA